MNFIWKNGALHSNDILISTNDRALRGDGVFDTMLCVDGQPVYIEEHLARLLESAEILSIAVPFDITALGNAVAETIEKNSSSQGRTCITITITRGVGARGLATPNDAEPTVLIQMSPAPAPLPALHTIIARSVRRNEGSPLSQMKTLNYGHNILARREAHNAGANEAILLNNVGHVTCFTVGNIFIVSDGQLLTPPLSDGVMDGIIRRKWIERADVVERSLSVDDLESAEAIFLTNSLRGIVPLASLNGKTLSVPDFPFDPDIHLG